MKSASVYRYLAIFLVLIAVLFTSANLQHPVPAHAQATYTVTNLNESGAGSLREAVNLANGDALHDTIIFAPGLNGSINLVLHGTPGVDLTGRMAITTPITINAEGRITINGSGVSQAFYVATGGALTLNQITLTNCFADSTQTWSGGAIHLDGGALFLNNSTISGNSSGAEAGALYIADIASATITNSTLSGNTALAGNGGAILNFGVLTITNSTISGNSTVGAGTAGGAIADFSALTTPLTITHSTITGNSASYIGGIYHSGQAFLAGAIIGDNSGQQCRPGAGGWNVTGPSVSTDASCGAFSVGVLTLGSLANNGGATLTHLPGVGSAAINLIPPGTPINNNGVIYTCDQNGETLDTDQRGSPRPDSTGSACDAGSVEVASPSTISINDVTQVEGNAGTTLFNFTLTRAGDTTGTSTVQVDTVDDTASSGAGDYVAIIAQTVTFAPTQVTQTLSVTVNGDTLDEGASERFFVNVTNPTNAAISDPQGEGIITDDDTAGVTVAPVAGLVTTEAGGTATFTVVLTSQPNADVTIALSGDATEGTIAPAPLTFTAGPTGNWGTAQTVTVTGIDDLVDDGDILYSIVTTATSTDPAYNGINVDDVAVTNTDNDVAAVTVVPVAGLVTTEAGGTATFTVVLTSQPTADVTIALSGDATEGTIAPAPLTFTAGPTGNWGTAQTVTVTGVNDMVDDGDILYSIVTTATSADPVYNGIAVDDVAVTNTDDGDTAGVTVAPVAGLVTTEAGGAATFTVVLTSEPTADVTISVSSSDTTEGTVAPASLTFTAGPTGNWGTAQTVTVTGVNDMVDDGDILYTIVTTATSADPAYNGINVADVAVTNTDDGDTAGVTVAPVAGLVTTEAGGTATFTVVLTSEPTADVTIGVSSSDTTEGTVVPASLTFTAADWNAPQTVTVTGANDFVIDGSVAYTIVTAAATSGDPVYNGMAVADVAVSNTDNDVAGITVAPVAGLVTTEAGGTATFTVVLTSEPTADVIIGVSSSDTTEGTVAPATLTFTDADWNAPQTVTVTGANDFVIDGSVAYTIVTAAAASGDPAYSGFDAANVAVSNADNDVAGIVVAPVAGLVTTEASGAATFTVVLTSQPTADVIIALSSSDTTEGTVAPASLTFTDADWNTPQTVTVTGVNDWMDDGDIAYTIITGAAGSTDPVYSGMVVADVGVTNTDNDAAGITVSAISGNTTEAGGTATFTVVLTSEPTADVIIALSSSDTTEGTVAPASLTFTGVTWNTPQTVTVTGVEDWLDDGDIAYTIITGAAASTDGTYNGMVVADVGVTNTDNDAVGIIVSAISGNTTEAGGTATFTVVLTSEPTADVIITLGSSDTTEGTVAPASLTFTAADWDDAQTVTVTGVDDPIADGNIAYTIITAAAASTDGTYNGMDAADVGVTNTDNEAAGVTVSAISGNTTESGGTATFTVVLNCQPTADVIIALSSSTPSEGTVAPASLTFTGADWNAVQTVTVTGVDDPIADGNVAYTIVTAPAVSADPAYNTLDAPDVAVTNTDNDSGIVASNDAYTTNPGQTLTVAAPGVLNGDAGGNGNPLQAVLETNPASGSLSAFNADGSFEYVPVSGFVGTVTFTYHATDGTNSSAPATVTITVGNPGGGTTSAAVVAAVVPPVPLCGDFDGSTNEIIRADVPAGTVTNGSVFCRVIAERSQFVRPSSEIGQLDVLQRGVKQAVDVFALHHDGSPTTFFNKPVLTCLQGSGVFLYLDATVSPRAVIELPIFERNGYTCASIPNAGTVVLVDGIASEIGLAPAVTGPTVALSGCMVTTRDILNLRMTPDLTGGIIRMIPYDVSLTAFERSGTWFYVDYLGERGWVNASYVTPQGTCG